MSTPILIHTNHSQMNSFVGPADTLFQSAGYKLSDRPGFNQFSVSGPATVKVRNLLITYGESVYQRDGYLTLGTYVYTNEMSFTYTPMLGTGTDLDLVYYDGYIGEGISGLAVVPDGNFSCHYVYAAVDMVPGSPSGIYDRLFVKYPVYTYATLEEALWEQSPLDTDEVVPPEMGVDGPFVLLAKYVVQQGVGVVRVQPFKKGFTGGGGGGGSSQWDIVLAEDADYLLPDACHGKLFLGSYGPGTQLMTLPISANAGEGAELEVMVYAVHESGAMLVMASGGDTILWLGEGSCGVVGSFQRYAKIRFVSNGVNGWSATDGDGKWSSFTFDDPDWLISQTFQYNGNVPGAADGNLVAFDEFGNIVDSGVSPSGLVPSISWSGTTANATPAEIFIGGVLNERHVLEASAVTSWTLRCVAFDLTGMKVKRWRIECDAVRGAANNSSMVDEVLYTVIGQTDTSGGGTGTDLWDVAVVVNDTDETFRITVTGQAATSIAWTVRSE